MLTGGKLAAGVLMAVAMVGGAITFLFQIEAQSTDMVLPIIGAAMCGFYCGWSQLGRNLGSDYATSGMFGVGAAAVAVVLFAFFYGLRSAYFTHLGVQFPAALDAVFHMLDQALNVVISTVLSSSTLLSLIVGSFTAGVMAEFFNRRWR